VLCVRGESPARRFSGGVKGLLLGDTLMILSRFADHTSAPAMRSPVPSPHTCSKAALTFERYSPALRGLGHSEVKTTMIYSHVLNRAPAGVRSAADGC
jgi:hypothetical protein